MSDMVNECAPALGRFMRELEQDISTPRRLVIEYTCAYRIEEIIQPGTGETARAIENLARYLRGQSNIDAESIRFTVLRA